MSTQKQKLYNVIETLPKELVIENEEDFISKVEEGIQDVKRGNVYSIDEAFSEIEKFL